LRALPGHLLLSPQVACTTRGGEVAQHVDGARVPWSLERLMSDERPGNEHDATMVVAGGDIPDYRTSNDV
jgi:hypothetical protein